MNKIQSLYLAGLLTGVCSCLGVWAASASANAGTANANAASTGGQFDQLVDDFVLGTLALSPATATGFGYHVHHGASLDDMLDDFSPAGIAASRSLTRDIEARIARLDTASLE